MQDCINLGHTGRWPYRESARHSTYERPSESQITTILKPFRTPAQRQFATKLSPAYRPWVRIHYGPGFNALDSIPQGDLLSVTGEFGEGINDLILNDASHYDFHDDWPEILLRFPEILDCYIDLPLEFRRGMILQGIRQNRIGWRDPAPGEVPPSSLINSDDHMFYDAKWGLEHLHVTGLCWIQDSRTVETGELLLVWLDGRGNAIRSTRVPWQFVDQWTGMFMEHIEDECDLWAQAVRGEPFRDGCLKYSLITPDLGLSLDGVDDAEG